jgi:hypothetical protein
MVVVAETGKVTDRIRARLGVTRAEQLETLPDREAGDRFAYPIHFTRSQLDRIGGSTMRIPDARREGDLHLIDRLSSRFPRLGAPPWSVSFGRELNATESRPHLGEHGMAVLEGKHLRPFAVQGMVTARIARTTALALLTGAPFDRPRLGYRDVSGVANSRSLIAAIIPAGTVTTHTVMCLRTPLDLERQHFLCGLFNSYVLNALVRMLMGGHLTTTLTEGLPVPSWDGSNRQRLIALLAEELSGRPDDHEVQGVLDAHVARLYGLNLVEFQRAVAGFPLVASEVRDRAIAAFMRIDA